VRKFGSVGMSSHFSRYHRGPVVSNRRSELALRLLSGFNMNRKSARQNIGSTLNLHPVESAKSVGLRYVSDSQPGIHRRLGKNGFIYTDSNRKQIHDKDELKRIRSLVIPPAWTDVWICPDSLGHLQATGRDAKGRKQYRYHPKWREVRDETKYTKMIAFGEALPKIRKQTEKDLRLPGLPRRKVLATVVRLLEITLIRVGNDAYARTNQSFGLTTMRDKHAEISGSKIRFQFKGKSGKKWLIDVNDRRLAKIVKSCRDIPGYELFQYIDETGKRQDVTSSDVNDYLREITGQDFTAKDFRTWAGTVLAAVALQQFETFKNKTHAKRNVVRAIECVAERMGNTPSICRKCYVHPALIESYMEGSLIDTLKHCSPKKLSRSISDLRPDEAAVMAFLNQRLTSENAKHRKVA